MAPSERLVAVDKTSVPWGPSDYDRRREDGSLGKVIPQAFAFLEPGQIAPFEYTFFTDEAMSKEVINIATATKAFLEELGTLLFSLKLEKVLGLRTASELKGNFIEFTVGRANIFIEVEKPVGFRCYHVGVIPY
jgi:hypothetical protein